MARFSANRSHIIRRIRPRTMFICWTVAITALAMFFATPVSAQVAESGQGESSDGFECEFELYKNRIFVEAFVNEQGPYRFAVDNGASGIGRIDASLVEQLKLRKTGTTRNSDGVNSSEIDVVAVDALTFGGSTKENISLLSRDYNGNRQGKDRLDGIIGLEFFAGGTLEIDYPKNILRYKEQSTLSPEQDGVFSYQDWLELPITFENQKFQGTIDTGSSIPFHFPMKTLESLKTTEPVKRGIARRAYTEFQMWEATIQEPFRVGAVPIENCTVASSELAEHINIGTGFLKDYILTIDQPGKLISLRSPDSPHGDKR